MAYRGDQQQNRESLLSARHDEPLGVLLAAVRKGGLVGFVSENENAQTQVLRIRI